MQGGTPTPSPTPIAILSLVVSPPLLLLEGAGVVDGEDEDDVLVWDGVVEAKVDGVVVAGLFDVTATIVGRKYQLLASSGSSLISNSLVCSAARPILTSAVDGTAKAKPLPEQALATMEAALVTAAAPQLCPTHCATADNQELVSHKQLSSRQRQAEPDPQPQLFWRLHC